MLEAVEVVPVHPSLDSLTLPIGGFDEAIQIKGIDGLDPVKASVISSQSIIDTEDISGMSIGKRNIVFRFGLNPDWASQTIASLRHLLYQYFMPKSEVTLKFTDSILPECQITGVVEDITPNMFSSDPEIQVSILCGSSDFVATEETVIEGVVDTTGEYDTFDYEGTKPTGLYLKISSAPANVAYTGFLSILTFWIVQREIVLTPITIDATHYFELNSVPGEKYARTVLTPDLTETNRMNTVEDDAEWPIIYPGENGFAVDAAETGQAWEISYFARFGGL